MILTILETLLRTRGEEVEAWLEQQRKCCSQLFYSSVDVRHSGHQLAPVDTNLFPAGFNNLSPAARAKASELAAGFLRRCMPGARKMVLVPENHTRNLRYIDNLEALCGIMRTAGYEVRLGRIEESVTEPVELITSAGGTLISSPLLRSGNAVVTAEGFRPDVVLVNNDFTTGAPALLQSIAQPVIPPPGMGWYRRRKSEHFQAYSRLAEKFAHHFGLESWRISTLSHRCGKVDFRERAGIECVALGVEKILHALRERYAAHGISDTPYVFIKADSGTYGMGIMTARSGEDVLEMNKKKRHSMDVIKEGISNSEVIIQEGVPTIDVIHGASAEPLMYLIDGQVAGGMFRTHPERGSESSLNAPGMVFLPLEDTDLGQKHHAAYALIARLATLAAAHEEYRE